MKTLPSQPLKWHDEANRMKTSEEYARDLESWNRECASVRLANTRDDLEKQYVNQGGSLSDFARYWDGGLRDKIITGAYEPPDQAARQAARQAASDRLCRSLIH